MKKLSIKKLIDFRGKSDRGKKTFVENIKSNKIEAQSEGGGDYWVTSVSAISNSYRNNNLQAVAEKINELEEKLKDTKRVITKTMYQRNIAILNKYKSLDLTKTWPSGKIEFLKKSTGNPLLTIKGLQIEAKPNHIFKFTKNEVEGVGAIWFIAKLNGYRNEETGMFADLLFRFLKTSYSKKYELNPKFCMAVDIVNGLVINYSQIEKGDVSAILNITLDDINKLM